MKALISVFSNVGAQDGKQDNKFPYGIERKEEHYDSRSFRQS